MAGADLWSKIHAERKALAADLEALGDEQWTTISLCNNWTVRDVVAHMTATARMTSASFFGKMLGSGFSLPRVQAKDIAVEKGSSPADALARFKAELTSVKGPPGPAETMLGETFVHSEDIRRALGISHEYPRDGAMQVADFYKKSNLIIGTKKRIDGLGLKATDVDWSYGCGPEISGPIMSLVMAMTGRKAPLDDLSGEGVSILRSRP